MASAWVSLVVFPLRLSFIPQKTCIPSSLFIPAASNESLSDYATALPPSHPSLSPLSSLASLLNREIWAWILIHVGESPCVFKRFCLSSPRSPSLCCLAPSLAQWVLFLTQILKRNLAACRDTCISYTAETSEENSGLSEVKTRLFYIQKPTSWWVQSLLLQIYFHLSASLDKRLFKRASFTLRGPIHSHYRNCWHMSTSFITPLNSLCRVHCLCFPKVCTFNM